MRKITPFLWFDGQLEEAMDFYLSIFKKAKVKTVRRYGDAGPGPKGSVMTASFELEGQEFYGLNGGPQYKFSPAVSFFIHCKTQKEVDMYWDRLSKGGVKQPCGWLQDKFGLSWQVVPEALMKLMGDKDPVKANRVMLSMMKMKKIDIQKLQRAHAGK